MKKESEDKKKKHSSALKAASLGRSATGQMTHHSGGGAMEMTGTNVIYEGASAPGAGGSVGTGYASGKQAVDATISTNSDYEQNRGGSPSKAKAAKESDLKEQDEDELETNDEEDDYDEELEEDTEEDNI